MGVCCTFDNAPANVSKRRYATCLNALKDCVERSLIRQ